MGKVLITSAVEGKVEYHPSAAATANAGRYYLWLYIYPADGNVVIPIQSNFIVYPSPRGD
jgi:hypothetical protein